ncbi:MAG: hypothetical protein ACYDDP_06350 [Acidithiobacillus sp.]
MNSRLLRIVTDTETNRTDLPAGRGSRGVAPVGRHFGWPEVTPSGKAATVSSTPESRQQHYR